MPKPKIGRIPAVDVVLPAIEYETQVLADWLKDREAPQRRPEQTARILALAVRLHLDGMQPWPVRRQVSEHTGVSLPMLDVVLSHRQATKDITVWTATVEGNIKSRESVVTQRFVQPSKELIEVVVRAMEAREKARIREERDAKRRERKRLQTGG